MTEKSFQSDWRDVRRMSEPVAMVINWLANEHVVNAWLNPWIRAAVMLDQNVIFSDGDVKAEL